MVRVGEFLAILTLDLVKKQSLVHCQRWTSPTEPSRVAFGRDQGLSLSLLQLRYNSPPKHVCNRSKSLTTLSRGLTQYKSTALDLKPLITLLIRLDPLVLDLIRPNASDSYSNHSFGRLFIWDSGKIGIKKPLSFLRFIWFDLINEFFFLIIPFIGNFETKIKPEKLYLWQF